MVQLVLNWKHCRDSNKVYLQNELNAKVFINKFILAVNSYQYDLQEYTL